ncbi:MAG: DUF4468 domain-containing protein [Bacteroidales bacterium]|jgi:hypothetical protein|nr:DUF4468 domain-containing protein [Bacteroidales bacterium]
MKRKLIPLIIFIILLATISNAQDFTFPLNEKGKVEFSETVQSDKSQKELFEITKDWVIAVSSNYKDVVVDEDKEEGYITLKGGMQLSYSFNPFAGQFYNNMSLVMKIKCSDNQYTYTIRNISITTTYVGYGMNNTTCDLSEINKKYDDAKSEIPLVQNNPDLSKKAKKKKIEELEEIIDDNKETLEKVHENVTGLIKSLKDELE